MISSEEINELAAAMAKAQATIHNPAKTRENPFFKKADGSSTKYADLATGLECIRPALSEQAIAIFQLTSIEREDLILRTRLVHSSGQWIESEYPVCKITLEPQKKGSALTYAQRQSLFALVGVAGDDDDDGNGANGSGKPSDVSGAPITEDQAKLIRTLIDESHSNEQVFLAWLKTKSIPEITQGQFRSAVDALKAKKAKSA